MGCLIFFYHDQLIVSMSAFSEIIQRKSIFRFEHIIQRSNRLELFSMLFCIEVFKNLDSCVVRDFISLNVSKIFTKFFFLNHFTDYLSPLIVKECYKFLRPFVCS